MGELVARVRGVRIVGTRGKALYLVGASVVWFVVVRVMAAVGVSSIVAGVVGFVISVAAVWGATRVFRGPSEDLRAARPLWRMSEKPTASRRLRTLFVVLAVVVALGALVSVLRLVTGAQLGFSPDGAIDDLVGSVLPMIGCVLFALAYGRSARWLAATNDDALVELNSEPPSA